MYIYIMVPENCIYVDNIDIYIYIYGCVDMYTYTYIYIYVSSGQNIEMMFGGHELRAWESGSYTTQHD